MSQTSGPLSINLSTSTTKTAVPMPQDNSYVKVRLAGPPEETGDEGKKVLTWKLELAEPTTDTAGKPLRPGDFGSTFFRRIYLYGKDGEAKALERAGVDVAKILDALLGTGDPGNDKGKPDRPDFGPQLVPTIIGLTCWIRVKHKTGEFTGIDIAEFKHEGDMKVA